MRFHRKKASLILVKKQSKWADTIYGSEALRDPKFQKKAIDYALDKLNPSIQNV